MCYDRRGVTRLVAAVIAAALLALTLATAATTTTERPARRHATQDLTTDLVCGTLRRKTVKASLTRFLQGLVGGPKVIAGKLVGGTVGAALTFCEELFPKARRVVKLGVSRLLGPSPQPPSSAPIVIPPRQRVRGDLVVPRNGWIPMTVFWAAYDGDGLRTHDLEAIVNGVPEQVSLTPAFSGTYTLRPGKNYRFAVRSQDATGQWSRYAYGAFFGLSLIADQDAARSTGWTFQNVSDALGGRNMFSRVPKAWTSYRFHGDYVAWVAPRWRGGGSANVHIDGRKVQTVSLYASSTAHRQVLFAWQWPVRGGHRITVEVNQPGVESDGFIILS
jgi:hypothetical protein